MEEIHIINKNNIPIGWMLAWRTHLISFILQIPILILYFFMAFSSPQNSEGIGMLIILFLIILIICLSYGLAYTMVSNKLDEIKQPVGFEWLRTQSEAIFKSKTLQIGWMLLWRTLVLSVLFVVIPAYIIFIVLIGIIISSHLFGPGVVLFLFLIFYASVILLALLNYGIAFSWVRHKVNGVRFAIMF